MPTQLVKRLVVLALFHVRQFVHHDHAQEFGRHVLEQGCDADLALAPEVAALHARDGGVRAQCVFDDMQFAVVGHFAQLSDVAQVLVLELQHVIVQRPVGAYIVWLRIFLQ